MIRLVLLTFSILSVSFSKKDKLNVIILPREEIKIESVTADSSYVSKDKELTLLIEAMIWVESRGNDSAYCKKEEAVGCLQIRPIMLLECNRILALHKSKLEYSLEDRWSREKSIEIFYVVNQHYNKTNSHELIARLWNGGPKWTNKINTRKYWNKVYRRFNANMAAYEELTMLPVIYVDFKESNK